MATLWTNAQDLLSGDALVDDAGNRTASETPAIAAVRNLLATHKGSYAADISRGPDHSVLAKATASAGARWSAEVYRALDPLVTAGTISQLRVTVTVEGTWLSYEVTFVDPQNPSKRQSTGLLTVAL